MTCNAYVTLCNTHVTSVTPTLRCVTATLRYLTLALRFPSWVPFSFSSSLDLLFFSYLPKPNPRNAIMKLKYQNGHYTYIHRRPYENYSFGALTVLLSHAKPGSEEHEVIEREIRFRKKEPKQDPRQSLLFNGTQWQQTRSPWCSPPNGSSNGQTE